MHIHEQSQEEYEYKPPANKLPCRNVSPFSLSQFEQSHWSSHWCYLHFWTCWEWRHVSTLFLQGLFNVCSPFLKPCSVSILSMLNLHGNSTPPLPLRRRRHMQAARHRLLGRKQQTTRDEKHRQDPRETQTSSNEDCCKFRWRLRRSLKYPNQFTKT